MRKENENTYEQMQNLYANIQKILKLRDIRWKDLALLIGISPKTLSSMKSQNQVPGVLTVKKIADVLDVSMDELFDDGTKSQELYDLYWAIPREISDHDNQRISCIHMQYIAAAVASSTDANRPLSRTDICRKEVHDRLSELMSDDGEH